KFDEQRNLAAALTSWAKKCQSRGRLEAMVALAQSEPEIAERYDSFDKQPWLLNVQNGTVNLRTGELLPHHRGDLLTKVAPVDYDPNAQCPAWLAFLDRIMDGNRDLIDFLQRAVGYSLTGDVSEQVLFFLHGAGANGKST